MRVLERNTKNPARCSTESESLPVKPFTRKIGVLPVVVLHHQTFFDAPLTGGVVVCAIRAAATHRRARHWLPLWSAAPARSYR